MVPSALSLSRPAKKEFVMNRTMSAHFNSILTVSILIVSMLITAPCLTLSQTLPDPNQRQPYFQAFPLLFNRYSGENGYEDLVLAGDLISRTPLFEDPKDLDPLLPKKRLILQDQAVSHVLQMVHDGLLKPVFDPRDHAKMDENTIFPEFAGFRKLARLMAMKEYVLLADGNTSGAIEMMRDGMKMAYDIQGGTLISGLVGIAIDAIVVSAIAKHFDQLSMRNCDLILNIVREAKERDSKLGYIVSKEKEFALRMLSSLKDKRKLGELLTVSYADPLHPSPAEMLETYFNQSIIDGVNKNPIGADSLVNQATTLLTQESALYEANLKLPRNKRNKIPEFDPNSSPAARVYDKISVRPTTILDRYDRQETQLRLLGAHASIIRFRWNHARLPETLMELKADRLFNLDLLTDPYTGNLFVYKATGAQYDLHSAGGENGEIALPYVKPSIPQL